MARSKRTAGILSLAAVLLWVLPGCLKTRAQLKSEGGSEGIPMRVTDVKPAGGYELDEIKNEITHLNGRLEDLERARREQGEDEERSKESLRKVEERIIEIEQTQAKILEAIQALEKKIPKADPVGTFNRAKKKFNAKRYGEAVSLLTAYLNTKDDRHPQQATFLRAEAYFNLKEYKKAIIDYSKFPEKYTRSRRMPEALWKIGRSFEKLGMKDDAKPFYQELVDKFPKSRQAKRAKSKLRTKKKPRSRKRRG